MIIRIIAVGKIRENHWRGGLTDYLNRLKPYARVENVFISEAKVADGKSLQDMEKALTNEAQSILKRMEKLGGLIVALDRQGKAFESLELAKWLENRIIDGCSEINWIIGGPSGLDSSVLSKANLIISFSKLTFPHQMVHLILLEQLYRCFRIIHNEPYHK
jgi:23S rRNA (pseudouridine1915-N3)-methyltransferase